MDVDEPLMKEWIIRQPLQAGQSYTNIPSTMKSLSSISLQSKLLPRFGSLAKYNKGSSENLIGELGNSNAKKFYTNVNLLRKSHETLSEKSNENLGDITINYDSTADLRGQTMDRSAEKSLDVRNARSPMQNGS